MINFDVVIEGNLKEHKPKMASNSWSSIQNINQQPDLIQFIYMLKIHKKKIPYLN